MQATKSCFKLVKFLASSLPFLSPQDYAIVYEDIVFSFALFIVRFCQNSARHIVITKFIFSLYAPLNCNVYICGVFYYEGIYPLSSSSSIMQGVRDAMLLELSFSHSRSISFTSFPAHRQQKRWNMEEPFICFIIDFFSQKPPLLWEQTRQAQLLHFLRSTEYLCELPLRKRVKVNGKGL